MKLNECLDKVSSQTVIRRFATGVVENRKEKDVNEIERDILSQLETVLARVRNNLHILEKNRSKRLLKPIILKILLEERGYQVKTKNLYNKVIEFEKEIINVASRRDFFGKKEPKAYSFDIYYTILKGAWDKDMDITEDEENILRTLRKKMNITLEEHWMLQAKIGIFPKPSLECTEGLCHNADDIQTIAQNLQSEQMLLQIIGSNKEKYYIMPEEMATVIKKEWEIELSKESYHSLLSNKKIFNKERYQRILDDAGIKPHNDKNSTLIETIKDNIKPSDALMTFVPKTELSNELVKACVEITGKKGYSKNDRIERIFNTLDEITHTVPIYEDRREIYYKFYEELASRDYKNLRTLKIIEKDLDIEKAFEEGTRYLFEKKLNQALEDLPGTDHPDGKIKIDDGSVLLWDNKSKEKTCNLRSHLDQFHRYIRVNPESVQTFLVIAPDFDSNSQNVAHIQKASEKATFALVKATDLKKISEEWINSKHKKKQFPLAVFNIAGEIDYEGLKNAFKLV